MAGPRHFNLNGRASLKPLAPYDRALLFATVTLLAIGLLMVASTSIVIARQNYHAPFYFLIKQCLHLGLGLLLGLLIVRTETKYWQQVSSAMLVSAIVLLILVLLPVIGHSVNGARRWLNLGVTAVQVSEFAKLCLIVYLASFLTRHEDAVKRQLTAFVKPLLILAIFAALLLAEPDFGSVVVLSLTVFGMLFLAGVRLSYFIMLLALAGIAIGAFAISQPYRLARLTTFLNPWAFQFDSGYQLTQSLIAFGRGGWFGVGLGESIQKMFYLPEAHTDFLIAVLGEELGLAGISFVMGLFALLVSRAVLIARRAYLADRYFAAYMAYGFALWIGFQATINIGVNMGVLPTKGLTLPFMSYGGSSLIINCIVIAILLRIDFEMRRDIMDRRSFVT